MKKYLKSSQQVLILLTVLLFVSPGTAGAQRSADAGAGMDFILLYPGESMSINFEYNGLFWETYDAHLAMVVSVSPLDNEVHELSINITPMGDDGNVFNYFTTGFFFGVGPAGLNMFSFEILAPRFPSGYEDVNYTVDMNPYTIGFIFSTVINEFPFDDQHDGNDFDYPVHMTMTLTLSN